MPTIDNRMTFQKRDLKGSRLRCLMLTSFPQKRIANCLTELIQPYGTVKHETDNWMPRGFLDPDEARLGETDMFLKPTVVASLTDWWLAVKPRANTPNWDLVATCTIEGKQGLILVEAKAHKSELNCGGKAKPTSENGRNNHEHIHAAIEEANSSLNTQGSGWALSRDTHYQLCNRFAWSWKLASLGIPVVLVYLGFLNADEMPDPFPSADSWNDAVRAYSSGIIPDGAWESMLMVDKTPIYPIIRSLDLQFVPRESNPVTNT